MTALGIDNFGKQVYRYGYEDFDYVDSDVDAGEDYTDESGKAWVFNAATSTFYNRLRLLFASELRSLYNDLDGKGAWDAENLITQWDAAQTQFPEEVWRQDIIRKYVRPYTTSHINGEPDTTFLKEKMNGRKKYHRREFERNQEIYFASKYRTEDAKGNIIRLRAKDPSGNLAVPVNLDLTITPYMHMYVSVDYANGVITRQYRAKAGEPIVVDYPLDTGDIIAIESAPYLQSIGDISGLYTQEATLTTAIRLKEVLLGNSTEGYANTYLQDATMPKDGLIETINIENIPSLDDELDVSTLRKLKKLLAKGSGITGLILAKNCAAETLSLPSLSSLLSMKNLEYLKDLDFDSLENLKGLIIEDCNFSTIDNFVIKGITYNSPNELTILDSASSLNRVRLTGIDWNLPDTSILERLYSTSMGGYNAAGDPTTRAYISGRVYVPGIRQYDYYKYKELWSDLDITYGSMTPQFVVTFVNDDGTVLLRKDGTPEIQYVDQYTDAEDPITREVNPIDTPTKNSTISTEYTFKGWDRSFTNVGNNITVTALYTETTRKYSVKYVQKFGNKIEVLQESNVEYGKYCFFTGNTPTYTAEEQYSKFYLFNRWDKSGYVDGEKVITAVYDECHVSDDTYFKGAELTKLSAVEIYALTRLVEDGRISIRTDSLFDHIDGTNISEGDLYSFNMGHDYDYDDLADKTHVLVDINNPKVFTGVSGDYYDTGITMLDMDRDFVIAVDYEFASGNTNGATLMECYEQNTSRGFKLSYISNPTVTWFNSSESCAVGTNREMLVLRHVAGEKGLYVYASNLSENSVKYVSLGSDVVNTTTFSLIFGCGKRTSTVYGNYAKGTVHWAKLWYADLGDKACRKLASYIHEDISLRIAGFNRYYLQNGSQLSSIDFIADKVLYTKKAMGTADSSGWSSTKLRSWLNNRFYSGIPEQIKQLIKRVQVKSRSGENYESISSSYDYIYIPAITELVNTSPYNDAPYSNESDAEVKYILHMASNNDRTMYDYTGTAVNYWTRTPHIAPTSGSKYYHYINTSGGVQTIGSASNLYGVVVEFSI